LRDGEWLALLFLLFPLFGVLMIWGAISATISAIRERFRRAPTQAVPESPEMAQVAAMQAASTPSSPSGTSTVFARGMLDDRAPSSSGAPETASAVRSFDVMPGDDAPAAAPPAATPGAQGLESLMKLVDKDAKLTDQQRADLAKLTPSQQEKLAKLGNFLSKFTKR
jgi:hypothetical protein